MWKDQGRSRKMTAGASKQSVHDEEGGRGAGSAGPHIVLAGGGTAGHVNPLLSVAAAIMDRRPEAKVTVIGTPAGLERDLVPQAGFELDTIDKVPFPRRLDAAAVRFPARWRREVVRTRAILADRKADVVVGFGGYASAPAYRAAHAMGLPLAVHEQNARAGMANRLGARWADYVGTAYDSTGLKVGPSCLIERVGLPLRPAIANLAAKMESDHARARREAARRLGLDPDRPVILVTGGSLGALNLNRAMARAAASVLPLAQVVHLTGKGKDGEVVEDVAGQVGRDQINDLDPGHAGQGDYHVAPYLERIDLAFACADLVICRAGAGSVSELTALGLPAIYVPLPIGNGEQRYNALPVVNAGGGLLVEDARMTADWVRSSLPPLMADKGKLESMRRAAWGYGIRDAAQVMAGRVLDLAGRDGGPAR